MPVATVTLALAGVGGAASGNGRKVGRGLADRLDARFPVAGNAGDRRRVRSAFPLAQRPARRTLALQLPSCRTPSFKAIGVLARAVFLPRKNLPHRCGRQFRKARVVRSFAVLPSVQRQQLHRPRLLRIAQVLRLPASQRDNPLPRFRRNLRRAARSRHVLQRSQRAKPKRLVDAAPDLLTIGAEAAGDGRDRRAGSVGEQHGRSRHPMHWFRPRPADGFQRRSNVRSEFQRGPAALKRHGEIPGSFSLQGSRLRHPPIFACVNYTLVADGLEERHLRGASDLASWTRSGSPDAGKNTGTAKPTEAIAHERR